MTSSSSPGIALKSEGISYCASARIPMVYANVSRGGPGVGSIQPAQMDYFQATKASGNGGFEMMVFAPSTVQEAVDMTYKAFDYADRDRNPVLILCDGVIGTMMEPVVPFLLLSWLILLPSGILANPIKGMLERIDTVSYTHLLRPLAALLVRIV